MRAVKRRLSVKDRALVGVDTKLRMQIASHDWNVTVYTWVAPYVATVERAAPIQVNPSDLCREYFARISRLFSTCPQIRDDDRQGEQPVEEKQYL